MREEATVGSYVLNGSSGSPELGDDHAGAEGCAPERIGSRLFLSPANACCLIAASKALPSPRANANCPR